MDQYASSPGLSTYCYAELAVAFINFLHYYSPSTGFYGTGAPTIRLGRHPIRIISAPSPSSQHFYAEYSDAILPIYPGFGQAPNNAGYPVAWLNQSIN